MPDPIMQPELQPAPRPVLPQTGEVHESYITKAMRERNLQIDKWLTEESVGGGPEGPADPQMAQQQAAGAVEEKQQQQGAISAAAEATWGSITHGLQSLKEGVASAVSSVPAGLASLPGMEKVGALGYENPVREFSDRAIVNGFLKMLDGAFSVALSPAIGGVHGVAQAIANQLPEDVANAKLSGPMGGLLALALENFSFQKLGQNVTTILQQPAPEAGFAEAAQAELAEMAKNPGQHTVREALEAAAVLAVAHGAGKMSRGAARQKATLKAAQELKVKAAEAAAEAAAKAAVEVQKEAEAAGFVKKEPQALPAGKYEVTPEGQVGPAEATISGEVPGKAAHPVARNPNLTIEESVEWKGQRRAALMGPNDFSLVATSTEGSPKGWLWGTRTETGFEVRKIETVGRGTGAARELYREAKERYGPYEGSTDLTPQGEGFLKRLRETDPDIFETRRTPEAEMAEFAPLDPALQTIEQPLRTAVERALLDTLKEPEARIVGEEIGQALMSAAERADLRSRILTAAGEVDPGTLFLLTRAAVGGLAGATQGETPEERIMNALLGAGLGAAAGPVARLIAAHAGPALERAGAIMRDETGAVRMSGPEWRRRQGPAETVPNMQRVVADAGVKQILRNVYANLITPTGVKKTEGATFKAIQKDAQVLLDSGKMLDRVLAWDKDYVPTDVELTAARALEVKMSEHLRDVANRMLEGSALPGELAQSLEAAKQIGVRVSNAKTNLARAQASNRIKVESAKLREAIEPEDLINLTEIPGLNEMQIAAQIKILGEAKAIEAFQAKLPFLARHGYATALELMYFIRLSSPMTRVRNMAGNTLMIPIQLMNKAVAEKIVGRFVKEPTIVQGETMAAVHALRESWPDALRMYAKTLKDGKSQYGSLIFDELPDPAITAANLGLARDSALGKTADYMGAALRFPGRELMAEDAIFKAVQFRMSLASQAVRLGVERGFKGSELGQFIEELKANPTDTMTLRALRDAETYTFTRDFESQAMVKLQSAAAIPALKLTLFPFFKVPMRIAEVAMENTPGLNLIQQGLRGDWAAGGERAQLATARVITSAALFTAYMTMASQGLVTGNGPSNPTAREAWLRTHVPNSFYNPITGLHTKFEGLEPFASVLATAADMVHLVDDIEPGDWWALATAGILSIMSNLSSKNYFQGAAEMVDAAYSPDKASGINNWLASWVPSFMSGTREIVDPLLRERNGLWETVVARTWWSSGLPPKRDLITGDPIWANESSLPMLAREKGIPDDVVSQEIDRLGVKLSRPDKAIYGSQVRQGGILADLTPRSNAAGVQLDHEQYDRLMVLSTKGDGSRPSLQQALTKLVQSPAYQRDSDGPEGGKAWKIKQVINAHRQYGVARLLQEDQALKQDVLEKMGERVNALRPVR
jgi:hypothetical protein